MYRWDIWEIRPYGIISSWKSFRGTWQVPKTIYIDVLKDHELLQTGEKQSIFKNLSNPYSKLLEKNLPLFEKNYDGLREKLEEIAGSLHEQNPKFTSSFIIPPPYIRFEARRTITNPRLVSLLSAEFYCGDIVCEKGGTSWVCGLGSRHIT